MTLGVFLNTLYDCPVVASVKDEANLERGLVSQCGVIFLLFGSVLNLPELVARIKAAGKLALVHLDLIDGLAQRDVSVEFIATHTKADGIITTRPALAKKAKSLGLISLQRFFLLDSMAVENMRKQLEQDSCDLVEVLPGAMPKVLQYLSAIIHKPMIAGGLINDKEDVTGALSAGAVAVSSTSEAIWFL